MDDSDTIRIDPDTSEHSPSEHTGLLQVIRGEELGREFALKPGNNILGRLKECEIQIVDKSISRRHAQIVCNPDAPPEHRYVIYDLKSTNGVRVNGEEIHSCALRDGDRVQLGAAVCKFMEVDTLEMSFLSEIKRLMEYDRRTELLQIGPFYERLQKALGAAESSHHPLAVLMMDLDGLKKINEAHGHLIGTYVIVNIAKMISEQIAEVGVAAIYGGDEFAAYLRDTTKKEAEEVAERIRGLVAQMRFEEKGVKEHVTISIGVASHPADAGEMMDLIGNADKALLAAKRRGKNCVVAYDPSMTGSMGH
jgi:diguanylate cyclase (GGDEF)-like protein